MIPFTLTVLGTSSSIPAFGRFTSMHLLNISEKFFLIDCGEGAQMQLRKNKIKIQRIERIFISHIHGDHYFGLPGLLATMNILGRKNALHIYSPSELEEILKMQFRSVVGQDYKPGIDYKSILPPFTFPLHFHHLTPDKSEMIYEDDKVTVSTLCMKHSVPCWGFLFREKERQFTLIGDVLEKYNVPVARRPGIKKGEDFVTLQGEIIKNSLLTKPSPPQRSFAYCCDTMYNESLIPFLKNVDLLYHDATFSRECSENAAQTRHSTAEQAAMIAAKANVKNLIIGHFSARYKDTTPLLTEAKAIFENTELAEENKTYSIN